MKHYRLWWTAFLVVMGVTCALAQDDKSTQPTINIRDYCDPESFNAVIGPDTCVRDTSDGLITFSGFVAELGTDKSVGAWRFAPAQLPVAEGAVLELHNLGGETHTFTQVKRFGGGFVDFLNAASGTPVPAPECATVVDGNLVPQPPSDDNIFIPAGRSATHPFGHEVVARYQCCIHPWMRITIIPKDQSHEEVH
jgi:plastocyanin